MIIGKLYSNSLMANLNSRSSLFKTKKADEESGVHVWKKTEPLDIRVTTSTTTADPSGDLLATKDGIELASLHDRTRSSNESAC